MSPRARVIGSYLSPYVRKVLVCLDLKRVAYEIDSIVAFMGDDRFTAVSPLRRIPVFVDDQVTLTDSTVICEYLEERYPEPPILPTGLAERARARWLEEFADTRMGEVFIWRLFNQHAIQPYVFGEAADPAVLETTLNVDIPHVLGYLESQVPADGFFFGSLSIADIAIGCFFRNAAFARYRVDTRRWPRTAAFVDRVLATPSFERLRPFEERLMRTPIPKQRAALLEMGAPLTAETFGTNTPRRGIMRI
jgi:glutathione S-transferase